MRPENINENYILVKNREASMAATRHLHPQSECKNWLSIDNLFE